MAGPGGGARPHHFAFKYVFSKLVTDNPQPVAKALFAPDATPRFRARWDDVGEAVEPPDRLSSEGLVVTPFPGPMPVVVITLPPAERAHEALSIATIWKSEQHELAAPFFLELPDPSNSLVRPGMCMLVGASPNGRIAYGERPRFSPAEFADAIRVLMKE